MAFIDKIESSEPILAIKFTNEGRKLLSEGNLNTLYFALGDSEINYEFLENNNLSGSTLSILKPVDRNPNILSFVKKGSSGGNIYNINSVLSEEINIRNTQSPIGFFVYSGGTVSVNSTNPYIRTTNAYTTSDDLLDPNNKILKIYSPDFNSIEKGDILILKALNQSNSSTTGNTIVDTIPYLKYRVVNDDLGNNYIQVDRNLPCYSGITNTNLGIFILKAETFTGDTVTYNDQDIENATFSNFICGMENFPFWKMSVIFTEEIAGVSSTDKKYYEFKTAQYAGFVSYIQSQRLKYKKLGVIHYSNSSPLNTYGESLFDSTPVLSIPTIMWHKSTGSTVGVKFHADSDEKYFDDYDNSLDTRYHDLVDDSGNVVGKVFNDLKIFVIEDQDLLFALSYKSNRSWTLPNFNVEIVGTLAVCATCEIVLKNIVYTAPQGGNIYGTLIFDVDYLSPEADGDVIVEAFSGGTAISGGTSVYMKRLSPDQLTGKYILYIPTGTYSRFEVRDIGVSDCVGLIAGENVVLPTPTPTPTPTMTPTPSPTPAAIAQYSLFIENISGGTTSPVAGQYYYYNSGTTVNINATPNQNYVFAGWFKYDNGNYIYVGGDQGNTSLGVSMVQNIRLKPSYNYSGLQVPTVTITLQDTGSYYSTNSLIAYSNVISDGGASVGSRGICWSSTNPNPVIGDSGSTYTNIGSGTGAMTTEVIGLSANTTYYLRAYAENTVGIGYSSVVTGTTDSITTLPQTTSGTTVIIQNNSSDLQIANILVDYDSLELVDGFYPIEYGTTLHGVDPAAVSGYYKYVTVMLLDANSIASYEITVVDSLGNTHVHPYVEGTQTYYFNAIYFDMNLGDVTIRIDQTV